MRLCVATRLSACFPIVAWDLARQKWEDPRNNWRLQVQARVVWEFAGVRRPRAHNTADARVKRKLLV
jgi:hypothetical protein